jgi:hypothetical protein
MPAAARYSAVLKSLHGEMRERRPGHSVGKAEVLGEETGRSTRGDAEVGGRASKERHAEITSGRATIQQGLATTCKDLPNEARAEEAGG